MGRFTSSSPRANATRLQPGTAPKVSATLLVHLGHHLLHVLTTCFRFFGFIVAHHKTNAQSKVQHRNRNQHNVKTPKSAGSSSTRSQAKSPLHQQRDCTATVPAPPPETAAREAGWKHVRAELSALDYFFDVGSCDAGADRLESSFPAKVSRRHALQCSALRAGPADCKLFDGHDKMGQIWCANTYDLSNFLLSFAPRTRSCRGSTPP